MVNRIVNIIVSGVGGAPQFKPNPLRPTLDDPTICRGTTQAILKAVKSTPHSRKPILVVISSTGISDYGRDIPIAMIPLYHWLLPVPHKDKKEMEILLAADAKIGFSAIGGFIAVRPSLLTDGPAHGVAKIRVGIENSEAVEFPAIGYTISREDVGEWIFEAVLKDKEGKRRMYLNKFVTVTY